MSTRITADIDTKNKYDLMFYLCNAIKYIKQIYKLELRKSNSKGYHLIVWTLRNYKQNYIYTLRKRLGDDLNRIKFDKYRKIGKNTLFDKKKYV